MYRTIVVGTDGSVDALGAVRRAVQLAQQEPEAVVVHLVSAYQPLSKSQVAYLRNAVPEEFRERVRADMSPRVALSDATKLLDGAGIAHTTHEPHQPPVEAILAVAKEVDADLIIVGSQGLGSGRRLVLGGIAATLASDAPIDVLITRQHQTSEPESVTSALGRLSEAASRFETDHPDLVRTISDVSYYLSGMGI